jgi:hypothetical protein
LIAAGDRGGGVELGERGGREVEIWIGRVGESRQTFREVRWAWEIGIGELSLSCPVFPLGLALLLLGCVSLEWFLLQYYINMLYFFFPF